MVEEGTRGMELAPPKSERARQAAGRKDMPAKLRGDVQQILCCRIEWALVHKREEATGPVLEGCLVRKWNRVRENSEMIQ
jgi:hypothetical protein